jgi:ligand-binding sensor domain-containing protein
MPNKLLNRNFIPNGYRIGHSLSRFLCVFLLPFLSFSGLAQKPAFRNFQVKDGLPSSEVYNVMQDSKGYIWFCTDAGVSRYDGYVFKNYSTQNGLPDNTIFGSIEDSKGRIWFRSMSGKIAYLQGDSIHAIAANAFLKTEIRNHIMTSLYVDPGDTIWYTVTTIAGVYKIAPPYGPANITLMLLPHSYSEFIFQVDSIGTLWGTIDQIRYPPKGWPGLMPSFIGKFNKKGFISSMYGAAGISPHSKYLHTTSGQDIFSAYKEVGINDKGSSQPILVSLSAISLYEDKQGVLWTGLYRHGVHPLLPDHSPDENRHYLQEYSVTGMLIDAEGGYWFTTLENGVYYMASENFRYYNEQTVLSTNKVFTILPWDSSHVLTGMADGSIFLVGTHDIRLFDKSRNVSVYKLEYGSGRSILVGSDSSYTLYPFRKKKLVPMKNQAAKVFFRSFALNSKKELWGGNFLYLAKIDTGTGAVMQKVPVMSRVISMVFDNQDCLWLGCSEGLWKYEHDSLSCVSEHNLLLQYPIEDLKQGSDGVWWYATKGNGLILRSGKGYFHLSVSNGLTGNICQSIAMESSGIVWLSTNAGINKITPLSWGNYKIETYTTEDGLYSNEIYQLAITGHTLWAASNSRLITFDTRLSSDKTNPPPIYINSCDVNYQKQDISKKLELKYTQRFVRINFVGLAYKRGTGLKYKYRLEGLDSSWNYTEATSIQYTPLPPGDYTFQVTAINNNQRESKVPATLSFHIAKPFWMEYWFLAVVALTTITLLYLMYTRRLKIIKKRLLREEVFHRKISEIELKALRAQMNPHFIFNCIASIQNYILKSDADAANKYLSKFSRLIRLVLINSTHEYISLENELETLVLYLDLESMRFQQKFRYEMICNPVLDPQKILIAPLIIQPYVENAIWHGLMHLQERKGELRITLARDGEFLKCSIDDNGIGRKKSMESKQASKHKSLGLSITRERLENINAIYRSKLSVNFIDKYDAQGIPLGTTVELFIPLSISE